jgi:hypothetical protein
MQMLVLKRHSDLEELPAREGCHSGTIDEQCKQAVVPDMLARNPTIDPLQRHGERLPSNSEREVIEDDEPPIIADAHWPVVQQDPH